MTVSRSPIRHLVIVLGDQLDATACAFDGFDNQRDLVWMAEVDEESTHVWSSKPRIALFLSAMRHFAQSQSQVGRRVDFVRLTDPDGYQVEVVHGMAMLAPIPVARPAVNSGNDKFRRKGELYVEQA